MRRIESALERIAAACLMAVMLIVFADVGARYLLSMPFSWSYEFIGMYLMPTLFYFAPSSTLAAGHHVALKGAQPAAGMTSSSERRTGSAACAFYRPNSLFPFQPS